MRAAALSYLHTRLSALVPASADFHPGDQRVDVAAQLQQRRGWVKLYLPSEEGDQRPMETFLVTVDCGAPDAETARALAEAVREGVLRTRRDPSPWRLRRSQLMDEGNYFRVQLTYRVQRPALNEVT